MNSEIRLELARYENEATIELARWVCLATRVESNLLRSARLSFMAKSSASLEADLWFGPLVQTRSTDFILFYQDVAAHLREELAADRRKLMLAWELVQRIHSYLPDLARLEEQLTWLALKGGPGMEQDLDALLRPVIKALLDGNRQGLARWAVSILPRLPEQAHTNTTRLLRLISEAQLYGGWSSLLLASGDESSGEALTEEERNLLIRNLEQTEVGVQVKGDLIVVHEPPPEGVRIISVPSTRPRVLDLTWRQDNEPKHERLTWQPGAGASSSNVKLLVSINTLAGDNYRILSKPEITKGMTEKVKPFFVSLLNVNSKAVGSGLLVDDNQVITTEFVFNRAAGIRKTSGTSEGKYVAVSFPFLDNKPSLTARLTYLAIEDGLVILEFDAPLPEGARKAALEPVSNVGRENLVAFGNQSRTPVWGWSQFEADAVTDKAGFYHLKPMIKMGRLLMQSWSGSPVLNSETGAVVGLLCLEDDFNLPNARLAPLSLLSDRFPQIFVSKKTERTKDFFISYNRADQAWAEWIAWQLEAVGYSTIVQGWDFRPGSNFVLDMQSAAAATGRTIAVLSPDYLKSEFAASEWAAVFAQNPTGKEGRLLPVRVRESKPKGLLARIVYIDLLNLNESAAKRALLDGVKHGRKKPDAEPTFPSSTLRQPTTEPRFPGSLPAIWNIPHVRNRNFTGREDELAELRASLNAGGTAAIVQTSAVYGLGGVGKTQLAVEYAYRHGGDYDLVWWLRSEDPVTLMSDYASLAAKLDLPEKDSTEQSVTVEAVKEWLRKNRGWLLIFDNAEEVRPIHDRIPHGGIGHIIITSRNPNWGNVAKSLSVRPLPVANAIEFLLKRTGDSQDDATAKALAEALGCLPLALEQASAYIEASGRPMARYLELFETRQRELMQRGRLFPEYPATVATTWSISFQNIERDNRPAAELLRLCAFFAPDDIPLEMITRGAAELPESLATTVTDAVLLDEALIALRKYSLIEVEEEKLSIHRLVQAVIRHTMNEEDLKRWTVVAVHVVNSSFPNESGDVRIWPVCLPLLPHASVALSHSDEIRFASTKTARLFNQVGHYLDARAEYAQAKRMFERGLAIDEEMLGPDHPTVAIRLSNLGGVLRVQGDLGGAKALFERALAIDEAALGPDHPQVAIFANNLGGVLQDQGDLGGAKALFERALAISEAALGPDHPTVAIRLNNLGLVLKDQGDLTGAKALFERAIAIGETALGSGHPQVATFISNLGLVLKLQDDLVGAKALFERTLAIGEATLGPDHPQVATFINNLGSVLEDQGDFAGAKARYERALAINEATLGPNHPTVATALNNLGGVLKSQSDLAGAKALLERAIAIDEAALGPDHPQVAIFANNLGGVLRDQGDFVDAKALYERALQIFRELLGDEHPNTRIVQNNLRILESDMKNAGH